MSQLPDTDSRSPYRRANSLAELLSWNDLDFVRCAYVTLLGRQPDLAGQAHYVEQIRAGSSKFELLWQLRRSSEAKEHDPGIAGLDRALRRAAWQRRPLMGAFSRFLRSDADGPSRTDRTLRALVNATAVNQSYLHALREQLIAKSSSIGSDAPSLGEPKHADPVVDPHSAHCGATLMVEQTPELAHLRTKSIIRCHIEDGAA